MARAIDKMKTNPKTLKKKIDKEWSLAVRKKFPRCIVCGAYPTQAHHAIIRKARNLVTRWMVSNGIGLCFPCHKFKLHGPQGDKVFLDKYIAIVNDVIPAEEQQNIIELGDVPVKYNLTQLREILDTFEAARGRQLIKSMESA